MLCFRVPTLWVWCGGCCPEKCWGWGTISREHPWEVMPDLYFYRDPEEVWCKILFYLFFLSTYSESVQEFHIYKSCCGKNMHLPIYIQTRLRRHIRLTCVHLLKGGEPPNCSTNMFLVCPVFSVMWWFVQGQFWRTCFVRCTQKALIFCFYRLLVEYNFFSPSWNL